MFGTTPSSGFFLRHIRNVEMSHVEIANSIADAGPHSTCRMWSARIFCSHRSRNADGAFALHGVKDFGSAGAGQPPIQQ